MKNKNIAKQDRQLITGEISSLLEKKKDIIFAYIYGSFVRSDKFSDIDIGIFVRKKRSLEPLNYEFKFEKEIQSFIHLPVDVRIINHAPLSFVYNVIKEGILITDKDASIRADFEGIIFKKYLDFAFFRKQYLKEVVNAPI